MKSANCYPRQYELKADFGFTRSVTFERLTFVRQMHGLGFSLREIKELNVLRTHEVEACEWVRDSLKTKLREVRRKIRELESLRI